MQHIVILVSRGASGRSICQIGALAAMFLGSCAALSVRGAEDVSAVPAPHEVVQPAMLRAGPIRLKLEDGELRSLRVGNKEIVRRIYFGVRDGQWNTAMPEFTDVRVDRQSDHFTVHLAARCKREAVDYHWTGVLTGTADGKITVHVEGESDVDFHSKRIGLCVLYGAGSFVGERFETIGADGTVVPGEFPTRVAPGLVATQFRELHYRTAGGLRVSCGVTPTLFDMEDQRNWGDSSWKAYNPLAYDYPHIPKGAKAQQTLTLTVEGADDAGTDPSTDEAKQAIGVRISDARIKGASVSKLAPAKAPPENAPDFSAINSGREKLQGAKAVVWSYTPNTHLPDNDTVMENLPGVYDQAQTARTFAPQASLHVGPIRIGPDRSPGKRPAGFAAAWAGGMVKYLSLGGVDEAAFELPDAAAQRVLEAMEPYAGRPLLETEVRAGDVNGVEAFAIAGAAGDAHTLMVINCSGRRRKVVLEGFAAGEKLQATNLSSGGATSDVAADLSIDLPAFSVVRIASR